MRKRTSTAPVESTPAAGEIPSAIAQTEAKIAALRDSDLFEEIALVCLRKFEPSLRRSGGSGDQQRDAVGGSLMVDGDDLVITASLNKKWAAKIEADLDGLKANGNKPKMVWSVTSVTRLGAERRTELEKAAKKRWGHGLKIIDGHFLALRLLDEDLLSKRQELLGLAPPVFPITRTAQRFAEGLTDLGAPEQLIGRDEELDRLVRALSESSCVELVGAGGVGKTRLAIAAADRVNIGRVQFVDAITPLDSDRLHSELAGADPLLLVVDNAHRRGDLAALLSTLFRRTGETRLLLIARPGFDSTLRIARVETPVLDDTVARIELEPMTGQAIGDLVRAAQPALAYTGSVEQIVALAEGNPQIALIAHKTAVDQGGLSVVSRAGLLTSYANNAVDTLAGGESGSRRAELLDLLGLAALVGGVSDVDESTVAGLLEIGRVELRRQLEDLADSGLMRADGATYIVAPDLLAAHMLRERFFGDRTPTLRLAEVWEAANEEQCERLCTALGGLAGFTLHDHHGTIAFLGGQLRDQARSHPGRAMRWAQALAHGMPDPALTVVDAVLEAAPEQRTAGVLNAAMSTCLRVGDFTTGWPRQLAIAQAFYAGPARDADDKEIREGLTNIYKRLPIDTSRSDGQILAGVVDQLRVKTTVWAQTHHCEPGAVQTLALAGAQMLTVHVETTYTSPEDQMRVQMRAGFLPGNDLTRKTLAAGVHLLADVLPSLTVKEQMTALKPLSALRRYALGATGAFGARPDDDLPRVCAETIALAVEALGELDSLPLPTRAAAVNLLQANPWPDDQELTGYRKLFDDHDHDRTPEEIAELAAAGLQASPDLGSQLAQWARWVSDAELAGVAHHGRYMIETVLFMTAKEQPDRIRDALIADLAIEHGLGALWSGALGVLLAVDGAEALVAELRSGEPSPQTRVAIASGLIRATGDWVEEVLDGLADDEDAGVRRAVAWASGRDQVLTSRRIAAGVRACLPDDLSSLDGILLRLSHRPDRVALGEEVGQNIRAIVLSTAKEARLDGDTLRDVIEIAGEPRLAVEFLRARLAWFDTAPDAAQATLYIDIFPEELRDLAQRGAQPEDIVGLCDRLQDRQIGASGRQPLIDLLSWIDPGDALSDRIAQWLRDEPRGADSGIDERHGDPKRNLAYDAKHLLRATRDPDIFRARVCRILRTAPELELAGTVRDAREPMWLIGSEKAIMLRRAAEFETWVHDDDAKIAEIGVAAREHYLQRAASAPGELDDPDAEAG
jgi:hypothetical protein